ncbi:hypothetical protein ACFQVA_32690 [Actinomadura keratinilytica]
MTTTYTFDVFCSLDGYGAAGPDWTGYWGKQGPELLDRRLAEYGGAQRMVFGALDVPRVRADAGGRQRGAGGPRPVGDADAAPPGHRRVDDAGGSSRLAGRHDRGR